MYFVKKLYLRKIKHTLFNMKRLLILAIFILGIHINAEAQSIRLEERTPDIDVVSEYGHSLEQIASNYVCLIFIHSESAPCRDALASLNTISEIHNELLHTFLITCEDRENEAEIRNRISFDNYSLAFDTNRHTFRAFNVEHIPYGVIYDTDRNRTKWFGPIQQLNAQIITQILTQ